MLPSDKRKITFSAKLRVFEWCAALPLFLSLPSYFVFFHMISKPLSSFHQEELMFHALDYALIHQLPIGIVFGSIMVLFLSKKHNPWSKPIWLFSGTITLAFINSLVHFSFWFDLLEQSNAFWFFSLNVTGSCLAGFIAGSKAYKFSQYTIKS